MTLGENLLAALDGPWAQTKQRLRRELAGPSFAYDPTVVDTERARQRTLDQLRLLVDLRPDANGPAGNTVFLETVAQFDLSLMVKAGVQWGLFGGAIENLGTERHAEYLDRLRSLDLLGCFAMTETGHGSDVQALQTTATYEPQTQEFVVSTPHPGARKDYIGNAARDGRMAVVFAQLITPDQAPGQTHGVHALLVPIRDEDGRPMPGVTLSDCGPKGGLAGVDNGRIVFDQVRVPRESLLNRYADVEPDGTYTSPIENPSRRFFTMLGTLIRGRVGVAGAAAAAGQVALSIATRYALSRKQFTDPAGNEVVIMDYLVHQRRLLPLIARSYALQFAQNEMVSQLHANSGQEADPHVARELESRVAGLKAVATWHAARAIQESREACGGAGYLAENRLTTLRADVDVFTTFEGDNHVLLQLLAKELLTRYADTVGGLDFGGMVRFVTRTASDVVIERTAAQQLVQRLIDAAPGQDFDPLDRGAQLRLFEDRERHLLETAARRLRAGRSTAKDSAAGTDTDAAAGAGDAGDGDAGDGDAAKARQEFDAFNDVQDHVIATARAHVERVVLEAFLAGIDACDDPETVELLDQLCDLFALSAIEADKAWFLEHNRLSPGRSKAITAAINELCRTLRPRALDLVEGFGVPDSTLRAAMLD